MPARQIIRLHTAKGLALDIHTFDTATIQEVVDVAGAPRGGERLMDIGNGHAQCTGLLAIDIQAQLRCVLDAVGTHAN